MPINLSKRSGTAVGNFNFEVQIATLSGVKHPDLKLPVDRISGLGDGRTNVMRHRVGGTSAAVTKPFPGISTADAVTFEGAYLYDAEDLKALLDWREQVKGKLAVEHMGYYRNITITPTSDDATATGITKINGGIITLQNCIATRLTFSDFDINAPAVSTWSLEIEFEDMTISKP